MTTNTALAIIIALVVGAGAGYLVAPGNMVPPKDAHMMPDGSMMHGEASSGMHGAMDDMMAGLSGKTGDEFDQAFLTEMIVHHEGAVEMAESALQNAKHVEIKTMANAIISAQTEEISQMKEWLRVWYGK